MPKYSVMSALTYSLQSLDRTGRSAGAIRACMKSRAIRSASRPSHWNNANGSFYTADELIITNIKRTANSTASRVQLCDNALAASDLHFALSHFKAAIPVNRAKQGSQMSRITESERHPHPPPPVTEAALITNKN